MLICSYITTRGNWKNLKFLENTPLCGCRVSTQFPVSPVSTRVDIYRLSYEGRGNISFIACGTISSMSRVSAANWDIYDIVLRAIKLISPRPECNNLFITYFCLDQAQKNILYFENKHFTNVKSLKNRLNTEELTKTN